MGSVIIENSGVSGCDTVSLGHWFLLTFVRHVIFSSSMVTSYLTTQTTHVRNNTAMRTSLVASKTLVFIETLLPCVSPLHTLYRHKITKVTLFLNIAVFKRRAHCSVTTIIFQVNEDLRNTGHGAQNCLLTSLVLFAVQL